MQKIIIKAGDKYRLNLKELFQYKDLFWILAYRDYRVRYAQTYLGFFWAFIQPAVTLTIFTLIFGRAINIDTGGVPYAIFALAGMVAWTYFAYVMSQASQSIIAAQQMVKKIYFPRLILPLSKALVGFVDFGITSLFYAVLMIFYGHYPGSEIFYLPLFFIVTVISALAVGIWLSALTIRYRDFQHIVPFLVQIGLYLTPVAYPATIVPDKYLILYYMNPMAGVVEGFRWSLVGGDPVSQYAYLSFGIVIILFVSGLLYFKRAERIMADIV